MKEILKLVESRLKPIQRELKSILRVGKITEIEGDQISVQLSELEEVRASFFVSLNGLEKYPKVSDLALVFCEGGIRENAVILALLEKSKCKEGELLLTNENSSLRFKKDQVGLGSKEPLSEIFLDLIALIETFTKSQAFLSTNGPVTVGPALTQMPSSIEQFKQKLKGFSCS